jgi:hypothetical protein
MSDEGRGEIVEAKPGRFQVHPPPRRPSAAAPALRLIATAILLPGKGLDASAATTNM